MYIYLILWNMQLFIRLKNGKKICKSNKKAVFLRCRKILTLNEAAENHKVNNQSGKCIAR